MEHFVKVMRMRGGGDRDSKEKKVERNTCSGEGPGKGRAGAELGTETQLDADGACAGLCFPSDGLPGALPLRGWPETLHHVIDQLPPPPILALGCLGH